MFSLFVIYKFTYSFPGLLHITYIYFKIVIVMHPFALARKSYNFGTIKFILFIVTRAKVFDVGMFIDYLILFVIKFCEKFIAI